MWSAVLLDWEKTVLERKSDEAPPIDVVVEVATVALDGGGAVYSYWDPRWASRGETVGGSQQRTLQYRIGSTAGIGGAVGARRAGAVDVAPRLRSTGSPHLGPACAVRRCTTWMDQSSDGSKIVESCRQGHL